MPTTVSGTDSQSLEEERMAPSKRARVVLEAEQVAPPGHAGAAACRTTLAKRRNKRSRPSADMAAKPPKSRPARSQVWQDPPRPLGIKQNCPGLFVLTGNVRTGETRKQIATAIKVAAEQCTGKYGRKIDVVPLFNASYRMTVQDAQADDCDFWMALVGQDA